MTGARPIVRSLAWATCVLVVGCSEPTETGVPPVDPGSCRPSEIASGEGRCDSAGVSLCAEGFVADAGGCSPVLPDAPCGAGLMAIPGEEVCRPVMDCGSDPYGEAPIEPTTQHVDASYSGGQSDGSAANPWTSIQAGVSAVVPGGVVAVAAGTYAEHVTIAKHVRLWGRCPDMVTIDGMLTQTVAGIAVGPGGDNSEVHGVSVRSASGGVGVGGAQNVLIDRVWVREAALFGFDASVVGSAASAVVVGSLFENVHAVGVEASSASVRVEASVVRGVTSLGPGADGVAANVQLIGAEPGVLELSRSVLEGFNAIGFRLGGGSGSIEASVIRDPWVVGNAPDQGRGVLLQSDTATGALPALTVTGSVIERVSQAGMSITTGSATIDSTTIRSVVPTPLDGRGGGGIYVNLEPDLMSLPSVVLRDSYLGGMWETGLFVSGGEAWVERSRIEDVAISPYNAIGRGIQVQPGSYAPVASTFNLFDSAIARVPQVGIAVVASSANIERCWVSGTTPHDDGTLGDGMAVVGEGGPASLRLVDSLVADSARAGLASFGASVNVGTTELACNAIQLNSEAFDGRDGSFTDEGGNVCQCDGVESACQVSSSMLEPPTTLGM